MKETKIKWLAWNKETFKIAQELDKPILLGISAVWCHWCHVMDKTTYSDGEVARLIEKNFVPIRVDRDRRPDIDKRYNMGGWPSTVFLTPDGDVLTGGTYIPSTQMVSLLEYISQFYKKNKGNFESRIKDLEQEMQMPSAEFVSGLCVFQSVIEKLTLNIASRFDSVNGGFGDSPKFPHSETLRLVLLQHSLQKHKAELNIVTKTLVSMGSGGIYDREEGGFFRYSTTRDWSIPHYEKMCEDNAKLLFNYLEAYQVTGDKKFRSIANGTLEYINNMLSDQEKGGFYGSQNADEVYYKLSLMERKKRPAPRIDQTLFVNWNAMMISAYLFASVVLEEKAYREFAIKTVDLLMEKAFSPNKGMNHYSLTKGDSHLSGLLTDQTYMVRCLIDCYQVTANRKFLKKAENLAVFMLDALWDEAGGFYDKPKDMTAFGALKLLEKPLEENSVAADALLRLYNLTGKEVYLETAKKTLEFFTSSYRKYGITGAVYGLAVEMYLHPMQIHIVGSLGDTRTSKFRSESLQAYNPLKIVETLDPILDYNRLVTLGYPVTDPPKAYVCYEGKCNSVKDPENIAKFIRL
jgi:uncharacterized protein YyaL (SSP411 family)